jgi:hypothetical protein
MDNAAPLFGLAALVSSFALLVHVSVGAWLRWRDTERAQISEQDTAHLIAALREQVARVESALEAQGTDLERLAEGQRFTARLLTERVPSATESMLGPRPPARVITPH